MTALNPSQPRKTVGLDSFTAKPAVMSIFDFSAEALGELKTWLEQNPPLLPVTQVIGFSQFTAQSAVDNTVADVVGPNGRSGSSTPGLSALPNGQYVIMWGCRASTTVVGDDAAMGLTVNGSAYSLDLSAATRSPNRASIAAATIQTLDNNGSNSLAMVYAYDGSGTGTAEFRDRWLIALKFANA